MYIINVIPITKIPMFNPQILSYFCTQKLKRGVLVEVLLNKRKVRGVVLDSSSLEKEKIKIKKADFRIRAIEKVIIPEPIISKNILELAIWMHKYYFSPLGLVLKMILPAYLLKRKNLNNATRSGLVTLQKQKKSQNKPSLLIGENLEKEYLKKVKSTLGSKKQILFLVPEIGLINKYAKLFGKISKNISIIHGGIPEKQFFNEWQKIRWGRTKIILGTRKAIFLDFFNLGLIIIDKEESSSHGSWDQQPRYNARDVALKLGEINGTKVILGTEMPSVGSYYAVERGKYQLKHLKGVRVSEHQSVRVIDMKEEIKSGNYSIFSQELKDSLIQIINEHKQAILFINRRGLATCILCRDCGHVEKCKNCEIPFTYHETKSYKLKAVSYSLICHHCGAVAKAPILCPNCKGHRIKFFGAGTQRVADEFKKFFPEVKFLRLDSNIAPKPENQKEIFKEFSRKKTQVLIGTQLLLKGYLLPKVALVGIVSVETMLNMPDYRSGERAFMLINSLGQLTKDKLLTQSYNPKNYIFKHFKCQSVRASRCQRFENFYIEELVLREEFSWPPFSQIVKLTFQHKDPEKAKNEASALCEKLKIQLKHLISDFGFRISDFEILGPAPAFIPKLKNKYIYHLVIKIQEYKNTRTQELRNKLLSVVPSGWVIDVDPETIL